MHEPTPPSEAETFDTAFDRLFVIAYRSSFRILGHREDAEDVAMETLARAQRRWDKVNDHAEAWVTRVAANLALDGYRRHRTARSASTNDVLEPGSASIDHQRLDLVNALLRIPKRQRDTVILRYFADLTETETASRMGVSVGTVKQQTFRAFEALRTDLTPSPELP